MGSTVRLSKTELYSFAAGEFGTNLSWNMVTGFILYYYSNVVLLPVAAAGTLLLLTRVLDAAIDPAIGVMVDKTRTRFGRARPYLLFAGIPFAVMLILTFSVPDWSPSEKLAYAYITFTLVGILYSALFIPFNALSPLMTSNPDEKLRIGSLRAMGSSLGSIAIYSSAMALVGWTGGNSLQRGFTLTALIMAIGTVLCMLFVFRNCRERAHTERVAATEPIVAGLRDMVRNPTWLIVTGFALAMFMRLGSLVSVTAYFANDVLHYPAAIALLLSSLSFSILIGGMLAKPYLSRFGKRRGNVVALLAFLALMVIMYLVKDHYWLFGTLYFISNITLGIQAATIFTMIADAVDTQERLFGRRNEGLLTSSVSFGMKVGMAIGGSFVAYGLAMAGYEPKSVTEGARGAISGMYFGAPVMFAVVQIVIISFFKPEMEQPR